MNLEAITNRIAQTTYSIRIRNFDYSRASTFIRRPNQRCNRQALWRHLFAAGQTRRTLRFRNTGGAAVEQALKTAFRRAALAPDSKHEEDRPALLAVESRIRLRRALTGRYI